MGEDSQALEKAWDGMGDSSAGCRFPRGLASERILPGQPSLPPDCRGHSLSFLIRQKDLNACS